PGIRVGCGEPGKTLKTQPGQEVKGGLVGLIVDARGRPLELPADPGARRGAIRRWWAAVDAIPAGETFQTDRLAPADSAELFTGELPAQTPDAAEASEATHQAQEQEVGK